MADQSKITDEDLEAASGGSKSDVANTIQPGNYKEVQVTDGQKVEIKGDAKETVNIEKLTGGEGSTITFS